MLSVRPALSTTEGLGKPPTSSLPPDPWTHATLAAYKEQANHPAGSKQGTCCVFTFTPVAAGAPVKPCVITGVESKLSLDTWCKNISGKVNIKTGHGAVGLLGYIQNCPNLFHGTVGLLGYIQNCPSLFHGAVDLLGYIHNCLSLSHGRYSHNSNT